MSRAAAIPLSKYAAACTLIRARPAAYQRALAAATPAARGSCCMLYRPALGGFHLARGLLRARPPPGGEPVGANAGDEEKPSLAE